MISTRRCNNFVDVHTKGGSRHKVHNYEERVTFFIRHFSNYYILHRNASAARAACLDPRLHTTLLQRQNDVVCLLGFIFLLCM